MGRKYRPIFFASATVLWLSVLVLGLRTLWAYDAAPGAKGFVPLTWPQSSALHRNSTGLTLVMAVHPQCSCTRASVNELARTLTHAPGVRAYVLAVIPPHAPERDWSTTPLLESVKQIPGLRLIIDRDGAEARRFGAETSGQTLLYSATGHLLFSGGLTEARAHEGDNPGEDAIVADASGHTSALSSTPVFGCSLFGPCAAPVKDVAGQSSGGHQ